MRIFRIAILTLLAAACAHQQHPHDAPRPAVTPREETRRYTVLISTNKAGSQVVTRRGDELTVDYEFKDRGRGPITHTVMRLDERGVPASVHVTGVDYFRSPIEERFATAAGRSTWKSTAEAGEAMSNGFYASMYGPPEEWAVLARALLRNGGRMAALPGGELALRKVGETSVRGTHVTAYELTGLGFTPFELWLDDELNLFGAVSAWQTTIREGFEADAKALLDAQDARAAERTGTLAAKYMRKPTRGRLTLLNARIFDPRNGTLSAPTIINIEGNRIQSIGVPQERNAADVVDVAGKVVLPGLWDMHAHLVDTDALLNIAAGITSVRDLGNDSDTVLALTTSIETGRAIGPRVALAGLVDGPGPFQGPTNILASNAEEARKAVDFFAGRNYEGLKIYSSMKPELVPLLTNYAHERGMRVSGHIPAGMRASDAIDAGYDEIQHANMLFLNFMPDVTDTRTTARFTEVAKRAAELDLDSAEVRAFIEKLRARKVAVDPTVGIFEDMFTARAGTISPGYTTVADRLPPQVKRGFVTGGLPVPEGMDERYRASFRKMLDLVAALHRGGVTIVAGTDALAGFALHRELELYAQAGIPNAEVLRIATLVPAQLLKRERDLGTIEPGKLADLIVVDGNPLENISDIRRVVTVVKDGIVFDPKALYAELGVRP
ncbi:MAG TPA: amidohydrolase family protein [Thermoanaerobaculia bacterium]|nr:amidohydrolase family protein [Thermoanaerobaculia bacterium]